MKAELAALKAEGRQTQRLLKAQEKVVAEVYGKVGNEPNGPSNMLIMSQLCGTDPHSGCKSLGAKKMRKIQDALEYSRQIVVCI